MSIDDRSLGLLAPARAQLQTQVRAMAVSALAEGRAAVVIGHRAPWTGWQAVPHFARDPAAAGDLVVGPNCGAGLAKYLLEELPGLTLDRPAVVIARGCDLRGVQRLVADRRVPAALVRVLAIPCVGRYDARKVDGAAAEGRTAPPGELLADVCYTCSVRVPADIRGADGETVGLELTQLHSLPPGVPAGRSGGEGAGRFPATHEIAAVAALSPAEKLDYWSRWFAQCIRCYACRAVCPACHCASCILDSLAPAWVPRSSDLPAQFMFQFVRNLDVAGRCVGCGQCEAACPVGIPLAQLWAKTAADIAELFGIADPFAPGQTEPLGEFAAGDPHPGSG